MRDARMMPDGRSYYGLRLWILCPLLHVFAYLVL